MNMQEDDETPGHLVQLDKTLVAAFVARLSPVPLGHVARLELDALAETRTIHDGRRLLKLLRYMIEQPDRAAVASVMSAAIADLELMLPKGS